MENPFEKIKENIQQKRENALQGRIKAEEEFMEEFNRYANTREELVELINNMSDEDFERFKNDLPEANRKKMERLLDEIRSSK